MRITFKDKLKRILFNEYGRIQKKGHLNSSSIMHDVNICSRVDILLAQVRR